MTTTRDAHLPDPASPATPSSWRSRLSRGGPVLAAAAAHLPENAAYGKMALAALGASFGPEATMLGLVAALVSNVVGAALGGGGIAGGPRASLALLSAGFVGAAVQRLGAAGLPVSPWTVLALLAIGLAVGSVLQLVFGLLRLGTLVKYTPHPVRAGLTSGIGLLLILSSLPMVLGHGFGGQLSASLAAPLLGAVVVGLVAIAASLVAQLRRWAVPPVVAALAAGAATQAALQVAGWGGELSGVVGAPSLPLDAIVRVGAALGDGRLLADRVLLGLVVSYALAVAVLCSLETLLTVSVLDGRLRKSRDANRELLAHAVANLAVAATAMLPTSPSIVRSLALVAPPGRPHASVRSYVLALALLMLFSGPLLSHLPDSAVGGVLLLQGAQMVSPSLWTAPAAIWHDREISPWRPAAASWGVSAVVAASAIGLGVGPAVLLGALLSVLLFVRDNIRDVVRREWTSATRRSLKMRPAAAVEALRGYGDAIVLLELQGSLFFGTADALRERLHALSRRAGTAIVDLHQVTGIDVTAARILFEIAEDWSLDGRRLVFTEWSAGDARRRALEAVMPPAHRPVLQFADTTDRALEAAEDALLESLRVRHGDGAELGLGDTLLGRDLDVDELACLAAELQTLRLARGDVLFRVGDAGDAIYVSLRGDIGLVLPGTERRLASFGPGASIGEMAVLLRGTRSAEAVAETDLVVLKLPAPAFERLVAERPALAAKLLRNLTVHLADRVRVLTGELAQWVDRAAIGAWVPAPRVERVAREE